MPQRIRKLSVFVLAAFVSTLMAADTPFPQLDLPSFGLKFPVPAGYLRSLERSPWYACKYEVLDATGTSEQLITIQLAKLPAGQTTPKLAQSLADRDGTLAHRKWGDIDGFEIIGDPKKAQDNFYDARKILVDHDGHSFLLTYATEPGKENMKVYDAIVTGTVWGKPKPVAEAIKSRGKAIMLEGNLTADLPDPFRKDNKNSKKGTEIFIASDFGTDKLVMKLVHLVQQGDAQMTLNKLTADFPFKSDAPVTWEKITNGKAAISSIIHTPDKGDMQGIVTIADDNTVHRFILDVLPTAGDAKLAIKSGRILAESFGKAK